MAQKKYRGGKDAKAAKGGKGGKPEDGEEYEFPMPDFDEKAFMRREIESAKTTFWTALFALLVGGLAFVADEFGGDWRFGAVVILAAMGALGPLLRALGYEEEQTKPKALVGNWFLLVFTALSVWVVALNL